MRYLYLPILAVFRGECEKHPPEIYLCAHTQRRTRIRSGSLNSIRHLNSAALAGRTVLDMRSALELIDTRQTIH